jgi:Glucosidase II beta subunit-like protein
VDASDALGPVRYVSQLYTEGSDCSELRPGVARQAEVRFTCGTGLDTLLVSVREAQSCAYVFTVATPLLCDHPEFQTAPPPVAAIACYKAEEEASNTSDGTCTAPLHDVLAVDAVV